MSLPYMQYEAGDTAFRWHGGEYIDVGYVDEERAGEFFALDVINVWDYQAGMPRIPRSLDAFKDCCDEWLARQEREES